MPKALKSDAKKRLLVTDGDDGDALLHRHEVVRGLIAVDVGQRVLDRRGRASAARPTSRTASTLRVWIHSSSRPYCDEVLAERHVDGGGLVALKKLG